MKVTVKLLIDTTLSFIVTSIFVVAGFAFPGILHMTSVELTN